MHTDTERPNTFCGSSLTGSGNGGIGIEAGQSYRSLQFPMQFRLSQLFGVVLAVAMISALIAPIIRHWDLRSYYAGFYGRDSIPQWATGTGRDEISETLGAVMGLVWDFGPWVLIVGLAAFGAAIAVHAKGGAR